MWGGGGGVSVCVGGGEGVSVCGGGGGGECVCVDIVLLV